MKKMFKPLGLVLFVSLLSAAAANAQTKVFKEVAEDVETDFKPIFQDGKLVGYLAFTQLEQASKDSFNYKLTIEDENLNDIGVVNFREERIKLGSVSFEQDVLCLAYLKSNWIDVRVKGKQEYKETRNNAKSSIFTQFVSLQGKIIGKNDIDVDIVPKSEYEVYYGGRETMFRGGLKHGIQLNNIVGKGFVIFYGDDHSNNLVAFSDSGRIMWKKPIEDRADEFGMLASGSDVNLLMRKKPSDGTEGGFELASYNAEDGKAFPKLVPTDRKGNPLKVLSFDNDPVTGKPFLAGMIINPRDCPHIGSAKGLTHGIYSGVFSININGHTKKDVEGNFTYWDDRSKPTIRRNGYLREAKAYNNVESVFRDYQGNTWFAGCGLYSRPRYAVIGISVLTSETVIVPLILAGTVGFVAWSSQDVLLLKQDPKGNLSFEDKLASSRGSHHVPKATPFGLYDPRFYYTVTNADTKTDYLIMTDPKNVEIYNIQQKKIARTIPRKEGRNTFLVLPAKDGYYMVREYNRKEKTTRLSIEAL